MRTERKTGNHDSPCFSTRTNAIDRRSLSKYSRNILLCEVGNDWKVTSHGACFTLLLLPSTA
ncbi:unnamed protein product [Amoebophrya sp. A120]|nr:unnamed protein product [Amoebophrya sp. A120]|eukprot:GSA120T00025584001.1